MIIRLGWVWLPENYRFEEGLIVLKASRPECHVDPKETDSRPEGPSQMRRRPRLGGSLDRGRAERLEQAKMVSELSLLREDT